jgi:hypothetical protein
MRTRRGKIARLPGVIRNELNHRLHNGALGKELVPWLNSLPEVQPALKERFAGRAITEDNLSEWRRGGFRDWQDQQERRARIRELSADYQNVDPEQNAARLNSHTQEALALELAEELELISRMNGEERSKRLQRLIQEFCRLQNTRTRGSEVHLLETKAARERARPPHQNQTPFKPKSELFGVNRT